MAIEKQHGKIIFICDGKDCLESLETETGDWDEAKEKMRSEDWKSRLKNGGWNHFCPDCGE